MSSAADPASQPDLSAVPLFPLPNVVLLPRAVLPLHIFEERYKQMTADAIRGDRLIAMALLLPGWEKDYYQAPAIEPVVCVGTILSHERLPDGRYNFLLQGTARARIVREVRKRPYRVATLEAIPETPALEIDLADQRRHLYELFTDGPLARTSVSSQFAKLLDSEIPTPDVADLLAFNLLDDLRLKQALLADGDVVRRVARTIEAIDKLVPVVAEAAKRGEDEPSPN
jgi:Lon protease-like protein